MPDLKFIAIAITAIVIGFCGLKYYQKSSEALELKARLVQQEAVVAELTKVSEANAAAALKARQDASEAIAALDEYQDKSEESKARSARALAELQSADPASDLPVSAALERLRKTRFASKL